MKRTRFRWPFVAAACFFISTTLSARDKTDIVYFRNGDRLMCEIRELTRGKLTVKTDGLGTVDIEWEKILHLESQYVFQIQLQSGIRYVGTLERGAENEAEIRITGTSGSSRLANQRIVEIIPLEESFFQRLTGSVDLGYDFTQASSATSLTLGATTTYRGEKWSAQVAIDSLLKTQEGAEDVNRQTLNLSYQRFFEDRWFAAGIGQAQKNANQGLGYRGLAGGGIGRHLKQSTRMRLDLLGGAAFSREKYEDNPEHISNGELFGAVFFETYRFDSPKLDVTTQVIFLPNIVQGGRYRLQAEGRIRFELIKDFFWSARVYESFDNDPPSASNRNDFSFTTSFGWTF